MKAGREVLENSPVHESEIAEFSENVTRLKEGLRVYAHSQPFRLFSTGKQAPHDLAHLLSELRDSPCFSAQKLKEQLTHEEYASLFALPLTIKAESLGLDKTTSHLAEIFELWFSTSVPGSFSLSGDRDAAVEVMWAIISNAPNCPMVLDLSHNDLGQESAVPLILLLKTNRLTSLNLSNNNIYRGFTHIYNQACYAQDVTHLAHSLIETTSLKSLDLSYNPVDIRSRFIVEGLARGLEKNKSIVELNLAGCGIDLGASSNFPVFTRALTHNTTLRRLNLANNNIDHGGGDALIAMLQGA